MKAMKFKVVSPEHSAQIQEALFDAGYAWSGHSKIVDHDKARHLFAKDGYITYEMGDNVYFEGHGYEEYILVNGNFVLKYEQFKNMKILVADVFGGMRTQVANLLHNLGYKFCGDPEVYNIAKGFFTYDNGIIMKTDDMEYFKSHPNEEYVLVGDELTKASTYFVQPATKPNIPERFENPATDGDKAVKEAFDSIVAKLQAPPIGLKPKKLHDQERLIEIIDAMYRYVSTDNVIPVEWFAEAQYLNGLMESK
jgi:hypothetical protein